MDICQIKNFVREQLQKYVDLNVEGDDSNLFSSGMSVFYMLYLADAIESKFHITCEELFGNQNSDIMTVNGLTNAINEKLK